MPSLWLEQPAPGQTVLSGLTLAHTHLYSGLVRGMSVDMGMPCSFRDILERLWWRLDVALDEKSLRACAEVALLDALECGVTTVIDHHESPRFIDGSLDVLADAARTIGIRLVTCYGSTDRHGHDGAVAGLRENERFAKAVQADPLIHAMVGLHAMFTVDSETLNAHVELARSLGLGLHIHVAEDAIDAGAVRSLHAAGGLGPKAVLAHGVHLTAADLQCVADAGATLVHNVRSNQQNAVGYAHLRTHRGRVALGTDGVDGDLFDELRAAHFAGRAAYGPQAGVDAVAWLAAGLPLVQALGIDAHDDAVMLDYDPPTPLHVGNADGHLLFGIGARHVHTVRVAGETVLAAGKPTKVDAADIRARGREQAKRLWEKL